jgi:tripartite-type tricarboxylate transporter receptor subunit TctC
MLAAATALFSAAARADSVEEFYTKHNTVVIYVGQGPGSDFDSWARLVGNYLTRYVPGNPTFVVEYMPGAGSLVMTNYLYNSAAKDGTALGSFSPALPVQALVGLNGARFDPTKFIYIGSPEISNHACITTAASGVKTPEDAMKKQVFMGGTGPTTANDYVPPILNNMIGTKFKVITGFASVPEVFLAMDRNEVGGQCAKLDTLLSLGDAGINSGKYFMLFSLNEQPSRVSGLPSVFQYIKNPEDRETMRFVRAASALGRPFAFPPGVPAERVQALRTAFEQMMKDPEFLSAAAKAKFLITFTSGAELQKMVTDLYNTPPALLDRAKAMLPNG